MWYVKLHQKHCQIKSNTKPSLCCKILAHVHKVHSASGKKKKAPHCQTFAILMSYNMATVCCWIREIKVGKYWLSIKWIVGAMGKLRWLLSSSQLTNPIFQFLHSFTIGHSRWPKIMNRHRWGDFYNIVKIIYQQFLTCQVILEKLILFPEPQTYPSWPVEHLQWEFIQLLLPMDYQYVLVFACMFCGWVEAFPCCKAVMPSQ